MIIPFLMILVGLLKAHALRGYIEDVKMMNQILVLGRHTFQLLLLAESGSSLD